MADACIFMMGKVNFSDVILNDSEESVNNYSPSPEKIEIRNMHINIGTCQEISINNLAYLLKETIGFYGNLNFNNEKPDGTMRKLTDLSKLHKLSWKHLVEIEEGIDKMYNWYRLNYFNNKYTLDLSILFILISEKS